MKRNELYRFIFKSVLNIVDILVYITLQRSKTALPKRKYLLSLSGNRHGFLCVSVTFAKHNILKDYFYIFSHSYGQRENRREEVGAPLCRKEN